MGTLKRFLRFFVWSHWVVFVSACLGAHEVEFLSYHAYWNHILKQILWSQIVCCNMSGRESRKRYFTRDRIDTLQINIISFSPLSLCVFCFYPAEPVVFCSASAYYLFQQRTTVNGKSGGVDNGWQWQWVIMRVATEWRVQPSISSLESRVEPWFWDFSNLALPCWEIGDIMKFTLLSSSLGIVWFYSHCLKNYTWPHNFSLSW